MENIGVAFQKMLDFGQKDLKVITLGWWEWGDFGLGIPGDLEIPGDIWLTQYSYVLFTSCFWWNCSLIFIHYYDIFVSLTPCVLFFSDYAWSK